jgi:hypothetical protein|tara:strand:- start:23 stop:298 length:276 start_codon:yes stop_codon:yes gene_type:complete
VKSLEYNVGDLVWLASACREDGYYYSPPAIILATYIDIPRIFVYNEVINKHLLEAEDVGPGRVYDILYNGEIEYAVLGEWLEPLGDWLAKL